VSSNADVLLYFLAIFVPPIPVFMMLLTSLGPDVLINICLWILAWIPGVIHAWCV
ncbi:hypothetical protein OE88DRAFT_1611460, partial [Heliocybe sulcata]